MDVLHIEARPLAFQKSSSSDTSWYRHITNYLAAELEYPQFTRHKKDKFLREVRRYFWDESYIYKYCSGGIFRRCATEKEITGVLFNCHRSDYAGYFTTFKSVSKVLQAGFWWSAIFKDAHAFIYKYDVCQRQENINKRNEMPQNFIQVRTCRSFSYRVVHSGETSPFLGRSLSDCHFCDVVCG